MQKNITETFEKCLQVPKPHIRSGKADPHARRSLQHGGARPARTGGLAGHSRRQLLPIKGDAPSDSIVPSG